jgi:hypothetical protein
MSFVFTEDTKAQESRSSLVFSGSFLHFQEKQGNAIVGDNSRIEGYYLYPLNPGLGISYQYQIFKENYILAGINYQWCHLASDKNDILRFRYQEPAFSISFKSFYLKKENVGLFSSIGLTYGQMIQLTSEHYGHNNWVDLNPKDLDAYNTNDSFADIVLQLGILFPSDQFEIVPELGYRMKDNWMSFYRHPFFYGLVINYQLKFFKR